MDFLKRRVHAAESSTQPAALARRRSDRRTPFLSLEMLIKSKTTYREQDRADLVRLRDLLELKRQRGDAAD